MWHDLLIVPYDQGAETGLSRLMALDAATGATRWSVPRPVPNSWTTPILIRASGGEQIVCSANPWVTAYDPATGAELWRAPVMDGEVAPSPAFDGSNVYVTNKMTKLYCIRTDGRGDVTSTHVKWNASGDTPDIVSPLADEKIVLLVDTFGMLTCFSAADGAQLWQHEYQEAFRSSPTLVGDRIYLMNDKGTMHILAAGAEFKEVASAELGEASNCTPAFLDGRIYIRGKQNLYCISEK
jgi:outer membrane protein assembly factor BamB